jgi:hypothetical protein
MQPSPLSGTERLLVTADPRGIALARSLGARPVRAHGGYFLASRKASIWTALYAAGASTVQRSYGWRYRLPGAKQYGELTVVMRGLKDAGLVRIAP